MKINRAIIIAVCIKLGTFSMVSGQTPRKIDKERVFNASNFSTTELPIEADNDPSISLPQFSKLEVKDLRADSLGIGFKIRGFSAQKRRLLQLEKGFTYQLEKYLSKMAGTSSNNNAPILVLFLKDLWITEYDTEEEDARENNVGGKQGEPNRKTSLTLRADCFVKSNDGYYAALRFDTTMSEFMNMKKFSKTYIDFAFASLLQKLARVDPSVILSGKTKRSFDEIVAHYRDERNIPILNATSFQGGVYQTYEEFKNNKPSVLSFEIAKGKLADVLHVNGIPTRNVWGYCDGKYIFIKSGENYYPIVRVHDSFYFLGSTELIKVWRRRAYPNGPDLIGPGPAGTVDTYGRYGAAENVLFPLKLNWQTGKPY